MRNIWFLLIWLSVVAFESFLFSLLTYYLSGENCEPIHVKEEVDSFLEFIDRFVNYQSWFIPMIILYWPTKARKKENRSRVRAAKHLADPTQKKPKDLMYETQTADRTSDGYTSLDGDSYLDTNSAVD